MDKPTILIVEDNPRHSRLIRDNLEDEDYEVIEATNVDNALKRIKSFLKVFSIESEFQSIISALDDGIISKDLQQEFENNKILLDVSVEEEGSEWIITGKKKAYLARIEENKLNIYFQKNKGKSGKSQPPLIILIDVAIPEFGDSERLSDGGVKLLRKLRDEEKIQIPAIFVTIWANEPTVMEVAKRYKVPIVSKPLDMKQLLREIRKA